MYPDWESTLWHLKFMGWCLMADPHQLGSILALDISGETITIWWTADTGFSSEVYSIIVRDPDKPKAGSPQQHAQGAFILLSALCWSEITVLPEMHENHQHQRVPIPWPCLICIHHIFLNILSVGKVQLSGTKLLMIIIMTIVSTIVNCCGAGETTWNSQNWMNKTKLNTFYTE